MASKSSERPEREQLIVGVDEDYRVRESLASLLESSGYRSLMFGSAEDFLRSKDVRNADCLVTDLRMPAMVGLELARSIRAIRPDLPVISISARFEKGPRRMWAEVASAQTFGSGIGGAITDPSGASVAGVEIHHRGSRHWIEIEVGQQQHRTVLDRRQVFLTPAYSGGAASSSETARGSPCDSIGRVFHPTVSSKAREWVRRHAQRGGKEAESGSISGQEDRQ